VTQWLPAPSLYFFLPMISIDFWPIGGNVFSGILEKH
jgi:hypothetical protein